MHRGALFSALRGAAERAGAALLPGVEVVRRQDRTLFDAGGARYGPYGRIVGADGARSTMRRFLGVRARIHEHRWGALWGVFEDPADTFSGTLDQYFDGAKRMAGFLPTGSSAVSLFWSIRLDRIEAVRAAGIDAFRADLLSLAPVAEPLLGGLTSMDQLLPASYRQVSLAALARRDARAAGRRGARAQPAARPGREPGADGRGGARRRRVAGRVRGRAPRAGPLLRLQRAGAERRLPERPRRVRVAARPPDGARFRGCRGCAAGRWMCSPAAPQAFSGESVRKALRLALYCRA